MLPVHELDRRPNAGKGFLPLSTRLAGFSTAPPKRPIFSSITMMEGSEPRGWLHTVGLPARTMVVERRGIQICVGSRRDVDGDGLPRPEPSKEGKTGGAAKTGKFTWNLPARERRLSGTPKPFLPASDCSPSQRNLHLCGVFSHPVEQVPGRESSGRLFSTIRRMAGRGQESVNGSLGRSSPARGDALVLRCPLSRDRRTHGARGTPISASTATPAEGRTSGSAYFLASRTAPARGRRLRAQAAGRIRAIHRLRIVCGGATRPRAGQDAPSISLPTGLFDTLNEVFTFAGYPQHPFRHETFS